MRDQKRIKKIMSIIETYWQGSPDQRWGQMLINMGLIPDDLRTWNMEDDDLLKGLEKWQEKQSKQSKPKKAK
jgi:hypothetical protein